MAPTVRSVGTVAAGAGSQTPGLPAGYQAGDLFLLFVQSANYIGAPSGWNDVYDYAGAGSTGGGDARYLSIYRRWATASETAPTVSDSDHCIARIIAVQDSLGAGNPIENIYNQGAGTGLSTTADFGSSGTSGTNRLCFGAVSTHGPDATGTAVFSNWANSSLTGLTEQIDNSTSAGMGGGLGVATGAKASAGAVNNFTADLSGSYAKAYLTFAVQPSVPPTTVTVPKATATASARVPVINIPTAVAAATALATALALAPLVTLRIPASAATASVAGHPPELTLRAHLSAAALAAASAPVPTVIAHEPENVVIEPPVAAAAAAAPPPTGGAPTTITPPIATAVGIAHPITFWNVHEPPAITGGASFLTPRRAGPEGTSLYTETVAGIVPPPIAVIDFDEHTGTSLIWGDPTGRSMVFDGVDDQHVAYLPYETNAWTVVLWFIDEKSTSGGHIYSDGENRLFVYKSGGAGDAANEGRLCWNLTAGGPGFLFGPYVRDGMAHQVVLQCTGTVTKLYVDNVLEASVGEDQRFGGTGVFGQFNNAPATFFGGRIDEFSYFHGALSTEWLNELWWHGIGQGGPKSQLFAAKSTANVAARAPTFSSRQVYDSWQLHYDPAVDEFELDPEEWVVKSGSPFLFTDGMHLPSGTEIHSRDWHSFNDWFAQIELAEIPITWQGTIQFRLVASLADKMVPGIFPSPGSPGPMAEIYEVQETWSCHMSGGFRYEVHEFVTYDPENDDPRGYTAKGYDYDMDLGWFRLHSPHSRIAQAFTGYPSYLYGPEETGSPGAIITAGWLPYTMIKDVYQVRLLRLEIEVSGDSSYSPIVKGINAVRPTTKIVVPTATYITNYDMDELAYRVSYRTDFTGPVGPVRMRPPPTRTTARMLRPPSKAQLGVENAAGVLTRMLPPVWAGDKQPTVVYLPVLRAGGLAITPDIVGEPQDVLVEVPSAGAGARAPAPSTGGIVVDAVGITRFSVRGRPCTIRMYGRQTTIAVLELVRR